MANRELYIITDMQAHAWNPREVSGAFRPLLEELSAKAAVYLINAGDAGGANAAVAAEPRLLCLDEPSSGLSVEEVQELMSTIVRLHRAGMTFLIVSHNMELMSVSEGIHVLCSGQIIASGSLSEIQANPRVREAYLGA